MDKKESNKIWREKNKESEKARHKKHYAENKDYYKKKQKVWRDKNPERLKELKSKSYYRNREKTLATVKAYQNKNRDVILKKAKENYKKNPELYKERRLKYKYGLTFADKEKMFAEQEGKCNICLNNFQIHELHIDHNHKTNLVRGLLCPHCNTALGLVKEDTNILINMVNYLNKDKND